MHGGLDRPFLCLKIGNRNEKRTGKSVSSEGGRWDRWDQKLQPRGQDMRRSLKGLTMGGLITWHGDSAIYLARWVDGLRGMGKQRFLSWRGRGINWEDVIHSGYSLPRRTTRDRPCACPRVGHLGIWLRVSQGRCSSYSARRPDTGHQVVFGKPWGAE